MFVQSLYGDRDVDPRRLLSEILNAAEGYREGLADAAVQARVETLLVELRRGRTDSDSTEAAQSAVDAARLLAQERGAASFFGDLADRAMFATLLRASLDPGAVMNPRRAVRGFLGELLGFAVDHLVSRDASSHLGQEGMSTATELLGLRRALVDLGRDLATGDQLAPLLLEASARPDSSWATVVAEAWNAGQRLPDRG